MLRNLKIIVTAIIMVFSFAVQSNAQDNEGFTAVPDTDDSIVSQVFDKLGKGYVNDEVLIRFKNSTTGAAASSVHGLMSSTLLEKVPGRIDRVKITADLTVEEAVEQYRRHPEVEHAQPNFIKHLYARPDDPSFNVLWGLHNTGQYVNRSYGTNDADMDAPEAWDIITGSETVVVAVIDSGIDFTHPDLSANMWRNPGEINCLDEEDNDNNGYINDCNGWDFLDNDNDPADYNSHGTHVAGTIGAVGNNSTGVAGINWTTKIMALRVGGVSGVLTTQAEVAAIAYAVANGAKVINASYGGTQFDQLQYDAIRAARDAGVLFIAAAGNGGSDQEGDNNDNGPQYPSNHDLDNIIAVAATDQRDVLTNFSNYGSVSVDVAAPGQNIYSTVPTFAYAPAVTVYSNNFDSDSPGSLPAGWSSIGTNNFWAVNNASSYSSPNSLEDSPGGNYLSNTESIVFNSIPIPSVKDSRYTLNFRLRTYLDYEYDFLAFLVSEDQSNWYATGAVTGYSGNFVSISADYTVAADLFTSFYFGFALISGNYYNYDGVYIDNVLLRMQSMSVNSHTYAYFDGTSMSAAHVSGLAALIWSQRPHLAAWDVKDIILDSVDYKPSLSNRVSTDGRVNAFNALCTESSYSRPTLVSPARCETGVSTTVTFEFTPYTDANGDPVAHNLYYCEDRDFEGCSVPVPIPVASLENNRTSYAGLGYGAALFMFGIITIGSNKESKKMLILMLILTGTLLVSCGSGGGGGGGGGNDGGNSFTPAPPIVCGDGNSEWGEGCDDGNTTPGDGCDATCQIELPTVASITHTEYGLNSNTRYFWKVEAVDGQIIHESEIKSFTTGN